MELSGGTANSFAAGGFGNIGLSFDDYRMKAANAAVENSSQNFSRLLEKAASAGNDDVREMSAAEKVSVNRRPVDAAIDKNDKLYQACLELETFLVKNLLNGMRNTVQKSNLIDQGFAGKMYEDMLYDEYAKDFTKNAGFGLAEQAYKQLKQLNG